MKQQLFARRMFEPLCKHAFDKASREEGAGVSLNDERMTGVYLLVTSHIASYFNNVGDQRLRPRPELCVTGP